VVSSGLLAVWRGLDRDLQRIMGAFLAEETRRKDPGPPGVFALRGSSSEGDAGAWRELFRVYN